MSGRESSGRFGFHNEVKADSIDEQEQLALQRLSRLNAGMISSPKTAMQFQMNSLERPRTNSEEIFNCLAFEKALFGWKSANGRGKTKT